jgi:hypothetical protein
VDSPSPTAYPQALTPFESVDLKFDAVLTSGGPAVNFLDHVSMPPLLLSYAGPAVNRASIPPIPSTYASSATNLFDQIAAVPSSLPATTDFDPAVNRASIPPIPSTYASSATNLFDQIAAVPSSLPATTDFDPAVAAHPQVPGPAPSSSDASVLSDEEWEMLLFDAEGCLSADDE